ncbi:hypothetical protein A0H81_07865 [Grifola frondosa]|uniref:Uncharacterized protein n=1 Tax=Grifola frondosa TaxID=5627 RepID=A0A1C7M5J9_GRIFR|nr:hypothetical protein A0H81_07865 [Grifola frondosa]
MGGCVPVDVVQAYGPEFISGVLYVGGGVLSRNFHPLCMHPIIKAIVPSIRSLDATASSKGAADFVDSCVAEPLPFGVKLQWMGGYTMQTPQARVLSLGRVQDKHGGRGKRADCRPGTEDLHCVSEVMIALAKEVYKKVDVKMLPGVDIVRILTA